MAADRIVLFVQLKLFYSLYKNTVVDQFCHNKRFYFHRTEKLANVLRLTKQKSRNSKLVQLSENLKHYNVHSLQRVLKIFV